MKYWNSISCQEIQRVSSRQYKSVKHSINEIVVHTIINSRINLFILQNFLYEICGNIFKYMLLFSQTALRRTKR